MQPDEEEIALFGFDQVRRGLITLDDLGQEMDLIRQVSGYSNDMVWAVQACLDAQEAGECSYYEETQ